MLFALLYDISGRVRFLEINDLDVLACPVNLFSTLCRAALKVPLARILMVSGCSCPFA